jgi:dTMP kinase
MAFIISFEGTEGAGKGSCLDIFKQYLEKNHTVYSFSSPGHTSLGKHIRTIFQHKYEDKETLTELFLLLADRAELIGKCIRPLLKKKCIILLDRYHDSTFVYQGLIGGLPVSKIKQCLNLFPGMNRWPEMTFFITAPKKILETRNENKILDVIEKREDFFFIQKKYQEWFQDKINVFTINNKNLLDISLEKMIKAYESYRKN